MKTVYSAVVPPVRCPRAKCTHSQPRLQPVPVVLTAGAPAVPSQVLVLVRKHITLFSAIHVCAALNALAKHAGRCEPDELARILSDERFELIVGRADELMSTATPRVRNTGTRNKQGGSAST